MPPSVPVGTSIFNGTIATARSLYTPEEMLIS